MSLPDRMIRGSSLIFLFIMLWGSGSFAATLHVTNLNDSGAGSFRQTITDAAPGDSIEFDVTGTINLTSGELVVNKWLIIIGPWTAPLVIDAGGNSRIFSISGDPVNISLITMQNGYVTGNPAHGGAIYNTGNLNLFSSLITGNTAEADDGETPGAYAEGGGIYNDGTLYVSGCMITGNSVIGGDSVAGPSEIGGDGIGGGIANGASGDLTMHRCTLNSNSATGGSSASGTAGRGLGGGLSQYAVAVNTFTFRNCTFSGNNAIGGAPSGFGTGGGIMGDEGMLLVCCTVALNSGNTSGGGISAMGGAGPEIQNTIVADNTAPIGPDVLLNIQSLDYNLIENTSGAIITGATVNNIYGVDPQLGPLQDNGGSTWTHAVTTGSPALNYIPSGNCVEGQDQRGQTRPQQLLCEIGAYEKSYWGAYYIQSYSPNPTNNTTVAYQVGFDNLAKNFNNEADLIITENGSVTHTSVPDFMGGMNFIVSIEGISGDGDIALEVSLASDVVNFFGDPIDYSVTGNTIIIDNSGPAIAIGPPVPPTTISGPVDYTVTYTDPVAGVAAITLAVGDVTLHTTGDVNGTVSVSGSGLVERTVTISSITGTGTLSISIAAETAEDSLGNLSESAGPSEECTVGLAVPITRGVTVLLLIMIGLLITIQFRWKTSK